MGAPPVRDRAHEYVSPPSPSAIWVVDAPNVMRFGAPAQAQGQARRPPLDVSQLRRACSALRKKQPHAVIRIVVYQPDVQHLDAGTHQNARGAQDWGHVRAAVNAVVVAPGGSNVDSFIIAHALDEQEAGHEVHILSNDLYRKEQQALGDSARCRALRGMCHKYSMAEGVDLIVEPPELRDAA